MQADIVHLHDQCDRTVDRHGDQQSDHGQGRRLGRQRTFGQVGQGDGGDLGRKDQVGADGRPHHLLFLFFGRQGQFVRRDLAMVMARQLFPDLLGRLETEIGTAHHEQRRQGPGRKGADQQGPGQENQEFVLQRPDGDLADDGQLTLGREAHRIAGRHRSVVDHDPGGLDAGAAGGGGHVIDRGGRHFGDRGDVVEKGGKT